MRFVKLVYLVAETFSQQASKQAATTTNPQRQLVKMTQQIKGLAAKPDDLSVQGTAPTTVS